MVYNEKSIGEGVYAADENNDRSSARGSFVRSGGAVTVGASSTDVVLNIDAADIRLDATDYSLASGSVTLADNSTAYPRRDLVVARSGSFDFMTGNPIEQGTFDTLVSEGVIDSDGLPIHAPEDIPEIQPPAFQGERTTATLLAMVYVPPGTTDSTSLSGEYITDMRMEGIGINNVLRRDDPLTALSSGDAASGDVPVASGSGGIAWADRTHDSGEWEPIGSLRFNENFYTFDASGSGDNYDTPVTPGNALLVTHEDLMASYHDALGVQLVGRIFASSSATVFARLARNATGDQFGGTAADTQARIETTSTSAQELASPIIVSNAANVFRIHLQLYADEVVVECRMPTAYLYGRVA